MCGRPTDWAPLDRFVDPIPGCPERVESLVEELREIGNRIRWEVAVLEGIEADSDAPDVWDSDAAEEFMTLQRDVRPDLELVAERYELASAALEDYAVELRGAQDDSEAALEMARSARDELDEARSGIDAMEEATDSGEEWVGPDHHQVSADAQATLDQALSDLEDAIARRDGAADIAASAIAEHVEGDGLANPAGMDLGGLAERLADDPSLWAYLSPADRIRLIGHDPELVGNLDGIPIADRDAANRLHMARTREGLEARRAELEATNADGVHDDEIADIDRKLAGIAVIDERLSSAPDGREAYLMGFSTWPDERAIVAIGNPDHADNVVTYVPGTGTDLSGGLGTDLERVDAMADDANRLDENADTAAIMWLGYDAPPSIPDAAAPGYAEVGAGDLRDFQSALETTHVSGGANYTVMGHSYGSTVIGHAAQAGEMNADNLMFVGSPGVGVGNVSDLGMDPDRVFATSAFHDPVGHVPSVVHGTPPHDGDFGATEFRSDPGPLLDAHSSYWDEGNQSRDNMAAIVTGNHDLVQEGRETPGWYDTVNWPAERLNDADDWLGDRAVDARDWVDGRVDDLQNAGEWAGDRVSDGIGEVEDGLRDGISRIPGVDL